MIFYEKLVLHFPLVHYGTIDGLINRERDVEIDENGDLWWHADVTIGKDDEGCDIPYGVTAHGLLDQNCNCTTEGLYLTVESDVGDNQFKVISGIRIIECV